MLNSFEKHCLNENHSHLCFITSSFLSFSLSFFLCVSLFAFSTQYTSYLIPAEQHESTKIVMILQFTWNETEERFEKTKTVQMNRGKNKNKKITRKKTVGRNSEGKRKIECPCIFQHMYWRVETLTMFHIKISGLICTKERQFLRMSHTFTEQASYISYIQEAIANGNGNAKCLYCH